MTARIYKLLDTKQRINRFETKSITHVVIIYKDFTTKSLILAQDER